MIASRRGTGMGHVELGCEPVGIDDALRGDGRDDEFDTVAAQAFRFRCNRAHGHVRVVRLRSERGHLVGGEVPSVAPG